MPTFTPVCLSFSPIYVSPSVPIPLLIGIFRSLKQHTKTTLISQGRCCFSMVEEDFCLLPKLYWGQYCSTHQLTTSDFSVEFLIPGEVLRVYLNMLITVNKHMYIDNIFNSGHFIAMYCVCMLIIFSFILSSITLLLHPLLPLLCHQFPQLAVFPSLQ